ncbi:transcriptional activator acu-15 [Fusarium beomiforme]|uniref:Transcriptional activator acu-15 n=1 Tax=Fusarium beomiforme TaxID=44412 RepID=A0A9P5A735_9HYPO|nr:transcriptional activator acu-15 [Fusarium beomiforme]
MSYHESQGTFSRRHGLNDEDGHDGTRLGAIHELRDAIDCYENLVHRILSKKKQDHFDSKELHKTVKDRAKKALDRVVSITDSRAGNIDSISDLDQVSHLRPSQNQHRYLGEVSDIHFFNLVKGFLQTQDLSNLKQHFDSYEQDGEIWETNDGSNEPTALPGLIETRELVEVYFSTIHIAYPFIPQFPFMAVWDEFQSLAREDRTPTDATDLAILYVICAIGSYYTSFPGRDSDLRTRHERYYQHAMTLAAATARHRSIHQVSLLLVQCFYLLAVCKTDSCWTTLGQAVRIAQSIGLHMESPYSKSYSATELERRRRIWYSIYVLDRLLSLQLGRPPAIHDEDCSVALPSRHADNEIDWASNTIEPAEEGPSAGDYFIAVIAFSHIVGCVLRDIYGPAQVRPTPEMMLSTQTLDRRLVEWRLNLPRKLRFDLGHALDQNITFRRQRNMLAIKFHHLRALIHRPYLCYPILRQLDDPSIGLPQVDWPLSGLFEKTCVDEARQTARLLHHVSDKQDLVQEFPWWQMISCLICAGSILLVSSIFSQQPPDDPSEYDTEGLRDDAKTCLKIFEALSSNSRSAGIARDMIRGLEQCGTDWRNAWKISGVSFDNRKKRGFSTLKVSDLDEQNIA